MLRTASVAAGALLFARFGASGVVGAIAGFVFAAVVIVPVAISRAGLGKTGAGGPSTVEYLGFLGPLAVGQIFLNLLFQTDFMLLSRALGQAAPDSDAADRLVGVYRGVQLFSFLPYQMLVSITFILFPMVARAHADGNRDEVKRYVMTGVRLAFILTGLMCGTVSALAPHVLRFAFPAEIADNGAAALRISSLGMGAFAILGIVSAALTSLKRELTTAVLTAATVAMVAAGCFTVIPRAQFGPQMLTYAATTTACALLAAAVVGGIYLRRVAGGFVRPVTLVRVLIATAAVVILGPSAPWLGKPAVLVEAAAVGAAYLVVLVVLGELGKDDVATVRRALGRRR
jgi:stage V sporulation protein B